MSKKKQISLLVLGLMITIGMVVGVTYALWQITLQQTNSNVITTGCFDVTLEEGEAITLNNAYPMTDVEGASLAPYTFTIKNNCAEKASYVLNLETVSSGEKILSDEYVKASLKNAGSELFLSTLNSTNENLEKVINTATKAYKLTEGVLQANEEKTFELRIWMDEDTPTIDAVMNASFMGKITVSSSYKPTTGLENVMVPMEIESWYNPDLGIELGRNSIYTQNAKYTLKEVIYENKMNSYPNAVEVVDFSIAKDKSVLGYYVKDDETGKYILHIQADGKIRVNPNASYYGMVANWGESASAKVSGIENWDTSLVTDMSNMFLGYVGESLDLSYFDTSNVESMSSMLAYANSLTSLDMSSFDTSKVTNMSNMFSGMSNLTNLNLQSFNTSNVVDMSHMFSSTINLTRLDVSTFNTSEVTNMSFMFSGMDNLADLNISSFDTSNVTDMRYMFNYNLKLTNIIYGDKFIHKEGVDIGSMYTNCPANKPTHSSWNDVTW